MKIITSEKDITPVLIEEILHKSKSLELVEVKEIKINKTLSTHVSNICFFQVKYSKESPKTAPNRFFLKIPKEGFPEMGKREVFFYNTIANQMDAIPVIPCYDAKFNEKTGRSHILLKDISKTHFQTEYPVPPTYINCERHIEGLANLHSLWWDDKRLEGLKRGDPKNINYEQNVKDQEKIVQNFLDFIGDRISKKKREILKSTNEFAARKLNELIKEGFNIKKGKNLTLCHGDAHAWNAFYPKDSINGKFYLYDWQLVGVFNATLDLAYFMGLHWSPQRRKRLENVLLRKYHKLLEESGIANYPWEECYNDYRTSIVLLIYGVIIRQWSTKNFPATVWWPHLERVLSAFEDLNCNEVVKIE